MISLNHSLTPTSIRVGSFSCLPGITANGDKPTHDWFGCGEDCACE